MQGYLNKLLLRMTAEHFHAQSFPIQRILERKWKHINIIILFMLIDKSKYPYICRGIFLHWNAVMHIRFHEFTI